MTIGMAVEDLESVKSSAIDVEFDDVELDDSDRFKFSFRKFYQFVGPGFLMSIAYLDPGNLEADLSAGALAGYQLLWVLFLCTAIGLFLQCLASKLGVVTEKHLAQHCAERFPARVKHLMFAMTYIAIIASDIQEIIGSAIAMKILFGLPLWGGSLLTAADTFTVLFIHYAGIRKLEFIFVLLISIMLVCFMINVGQTSPQGGDVMMGFVPSIHSYALVQALGLLGAVIMPHNLFLGSALVLSRRVDRSLPSQRQLDVIEQHRRDSDVSLLRDQSTTELAVSPSINADSSLDLPLQPPLEASDMPQLPLSGVRIVERRFHIPCFLISYR